MKGNSLDHCNYGIEMLLLISKNGPQLMRGVNGVGEINNVTVYCYSEAPSSEIVLTHLSSC